MFPRSAFVGWIALSFVFHAVPFTDSFRFCRRNKGCHVCLNRKKRTPKIHPVGRPIVGLFCEHLIVNYAGVKEKAVFTLVILFKKVIWRIDFWRILGTNKAKLWQNFENILKKETPKSGMGNRAGKPIANPRELNRMHAVRVQSESLGIVFGRNRSAEWGSIGGQSDQAGHLYSRHLACTVQWTA